MYHNLHYSFVGYHLFKTLMPVACVLFVLVLLKIILLLCGMKKNSKIITVALFIVVMAYIVSLGVYFGYHNRTAKKTLDSMYLSIQSSEHIQVVIVQLSSNVEEVVERDPLGAESVELLQAETRTEYDIDTELQREKLLDRIRSANLKLCRLGRSTPNRIELLLSTGESTQKIEIAELEYLYYGKYRFAATEADLFSVLKNMLEASF